MKKIDDKIIELIRKRNPDNVLTYVKELIKPLAYEELVSKIKLGNKPVSIPGGNLSPDILVISEQVMEKQKSLNKDFVYPMQATMEEVIFNEAIREAGIDKSKIFCLDLISEYLEKENQDKKLVHRLPSVVEIRQAKEFILPFVEILAPKTILILGRAPCQAFYGGNFNQIRGEIFNVLNIPTIVTYNPSLILFANSISDKILAEEYKKDMIDDFKKIKSYI